MISPLAPPHARHSSVRRRTVKIPHSVFLGLMLLHDFLVENKGLLVTNCSKAVAGRSVKPFSRKSSAHGIPAFFEGATGTALNRALLSLRGFIDRSLADIRVTGGLPPRFQNVWLSEFIADITFSVSLELASKNCTLNVSAVDASLAIDADREMLHSAVGNLLSNAFTFTRPGSMVSLRAYASSDRILIEVADQCGALPPGGGAQMLNPTPGEPDGQSGPEPGLKTCRRSVEANGGTLSARDVPGIGCVFTIDLPRHSIA